MTDHKPREVQDQERDRADESLQRECKEEERKHVEQQVADVAVHEAARDHRGVLLLALEEVWSEQALVDQLRQSKQPEKTDSDG